MKTAESDKTRQELINWISELRDTNLLQSLNSIRLSKIKEGKDWWDTLSDLERENIELGLEDIKNERTLSSKEFWNELKNE